MDIFGKPRSRSITADLATTSAKSSFSDKYGGSIRGLELSDDESDDDLLAAFSNTKRASQPSDASAYLAAKQDLSNRQQPLSSSAAQTTPQTKPRSGLLLGSQKKPGKPKSELDQLLEEDEPQLARGNLKQNQAQQPWRPPTFTETTLKESPRIHDKTPTAGKDDKLKRDFRRSPLAEEPLNRASPVNRSPLAEEPLNRASPANRSPLAQEHLNRASPVNRSPLAQERLNRASPVNRSPLAQEPLNRASPVNRATDPRELSTSSQSPRDYLRTSLEGKYTRQPPATSESPGERRKSPLASDPRDFRQQLAQQSEKSQLQESFSKYSIPANSRLGEADALQLAKERLMSGYKSDPRLSSSNKSTPPQNSLSIGIQPAARLNQDQGDDMYAKYKSKLTQEFGKENLYGQSQAPSYEEYGRTTGSKKADDKNIAQRKGSLLGDKKVKETVPKDKKNIPVTAGQKGEQSKTSKGDAPVKVAKGGKPVSSEKRANPEEERANRYGQFSKSKSPLPEEKKQSQRNYDSYRRESPLSHDPDSYSKSKPSPFAKQFAEQSARQQAGKYSEQKPSEFYGRKPTQDPYNRDSYGYRGPATVEPEPVRKGSYMDRLLGEQHGTQEKAELSKPESTLRKGSYLSSLLGDENVHTPSKSPRSTRMDQLLGDEPQGYREARSRARITVEKEDREDRESSICRDVDKDPQMIERINEEIEIKKAKRSKKKLTTAEKYEAAIDEIADAQRTMVTSVDPSAPNSSPARKTPKKRLTKDRPKSAYFSRVHEDLRDTAPKPEPLVLESTDDIRSYIYEEWLKKRNEVEGEEKKKKSEEQRLQKERELKEKLDKELDRAATYKTWLEEKNRKTVIEMRKQREKEREEKRKIDEKKREEALNLKFGQKKENFDHEDWLVQKLRQQKKQKAKENEKELELLETKNENKLEQPDGAFKGWKKRKEREIQLAHQREKAVTDYNEAEKRREKERRQAEADQLYQEWLQKKAQLKKQEKRGSKKGNTRREIRKPAWSPAGREFLPNQAIA